jgi:hypothetical protein
MREHVGNMLGNAGTGTNPGKYWERLANSRGNAVEMLENFADNARKNGGKALGK